MTFRFIQAEKANHPITMLCRVLGVSRSGYYAWSSRPVSARAMFDQDLIRRIIEIHKLSRETYGSPRIHAELRLDHGIRIGKKRVARLMCAAGVRSLHRKKRVRTTKRDNEAAPAPDLVQRGFGAELPDQLWVSDIKYVATWEGFLYLAATVDACTRAVVGWAMRGDLSTQLVLDALDMALHRRGPCCGLIHHSDRGCQYTSFAFGRRCKEAGIVPSMGSVGDAYDNAMAERSAPGDLRVHRGLLQPTPPALLDRVPESRGIRSDEAKGGRGCRLRSPSARSPGPARRSKRLSELLGARFVGPSPRSCRLPMRRRHSRRKEGYTSRETLPVVPCPRKRVNSTQDVVDFLSARP